MTLWIDDENGIWMNREVTFRNNKFCLISKAEAHNEQRLNINCYYDIKQVMKFGKLRKIGVLDELYPFPQYEVGDEVWIDQDWLYENGVDCMIGFIGSPNRVAGKILVPSLDEYKNLVVQVSITIPDSEVTKKYD
jgi:hypothetical protein